MAEPESIRQICKGLVDKYRMAKLLEQMDTVLNALENLPPVPGAEYPRPELTTADAVLLKELGVKWD